MQFCPLWCRPVAWSWVAFWVAACGETNTAIRVDACAALPEVVVPGFGALPDRDEGFVILKNSDAGALLVDEVTDAVAAEFGWPGTGWSTPVWAVALFAAAFVAGGLAND